MEFLQHSILFLCTLISFIYMIVYYFKNSKARFPPSPWKLPLIGNLLQLAGPLPHHSLRELSKKHGPIIHLKLGEISAIVISSPKLAEQVMKNSNNFSNRPENIGSKILSYNTANIIFAPYGDYHRQIRKICNTELLSSKRIQSFRSVREEEVKKLVKSISSSSGAPVNLSKKIYTLNVRIVTKVAFGKRYDVPDFMAAIKEGLAFSAGNIPDLFPSFKLLHRISTVKGQMEKIHVRLDNSISKVIDDHRAKQENQTKSIEESAEEDIVDVLLKLQRSSDLDFPFTTENIKAVLLDIFGAGTDTSATVLEWTMSELIKNPQAMEKAQAEVRCVTKGKSNVDETDIQGMSYLKLVIKESLRLHPPTPLLLPRVAKEACLINGYDVPAKTQVIVNAWAIARDDKYWENPESFEPERFRGCQIDFKGEDFKYIPFGAGRRICPGILFANASMELTLAQLLYHFDWQLPNGMSGEELDMTEAFGVVMRRENELHLIGIPYTP